VFQTGTQHEIVTQTNVGGRATYQNAGAMRRRGLEAHLARLSHPHRRLGSVGFGRVDNVLARKYAGSVIVNGGNSRFFEPAPGRAFTVGVSGVARF
jgi:hypothetical protein